MLGRERVKPVAGSGEIATGIRSISGPARKFLAPIHARIDGKAVRRVSEIAVAAVSRTRHYRR